MERRLTSLFKLRRSQGFFTLASSVLLWWTQRDLNPRPLRCERSALPAELWALKDYVIIILLCRHFCNSFLHFFGQVEKMVRTEGLEPSRLLARS